MNAEFDPRDGDASTASLVLLVCCAVAAFAFGLAADKPWLCGVAVVVLLTVFLISRVPEQTGSSEDEDGGDGGDDRPQRPTRPTGGIPLPDAEQSPRRVRDHDRDRPSSVKPRKRVQKRRRVTTPA